MSEDISPTFIARLFGERNVGELSIQAADGKTPVHYLGAFGYEQAYLAIQGTFPGICSLVARDGSTAASLFASRLKRELDCERITNQKLAAAAVETETVRDANRKFEQLQTDIGKREQMIKAQEAQIKRLTDDRTTLQQREQELSRDSSHHQSELDKLRIDARKAYADACRAREDLADRSAALEEAQEQCATLQYEMGALREQASTNATDLERIDNEKSSLEEQLALLRTERDSTSRELAVADTVGTKAVQHNRELTQSISKLESEIDDLMNRVEVSEREKTRVHMEKERLEDVRVTISKSLQQKSIDKESLESTVSLAQQRTGDLEMQLEAVNKRFRHSERELEQLRSDIVTAREQQKAVETSCDRQLSALQSEREALVAQLTDARTAARHTEENARRDIEQMKIDMRQLNESAVAAQERSKKLQNDVELARRAAAADIAMIRQATEQEIEDLRAETAAQKKIAEDALARSNSSHERHALEEHAQKIVADAALVESELRAKLKDALDNTAAELQERARLVTTTEQQCVDLRNQLKENKDKMADLERVSLENYNSAAEWQRYTNEVQERHDGSVKELREKLQSAEELLRHTRKELEQERAIASTRDNAHHVITPEKPSGPAPQRPRPVNAVVSYARNASLKRVKTLRSIDTAAIAEKDSPREKEKEADEETQLMLRNQELNAEFNSRIFMLVREGNYKVLTELFNLGLNPNTRCTEPGSLGQTMLEVAVRGVADAQGMKNLKKTPEHVDVVIDQLIKTVPLLVQRGGDWEDLDDYLQSDGYRLPDKFVYILKKRDDASPFCKALLDGRVGDAEKHLGNVENLNRVPTKFEKEGFTYLHVAISHEAARLVQAMLLTGNVSVSARDNNDRTPLHLLLELCSDQPTRLMIAQYLLAAGASAQEPCRYEKIINHSRSKLESFSVDTTAAPSSKLKNVFKRKERSTKTLVHDLGKLQTEARRFGTPLAMAQALGDQELVACMKNRRFLLPTVDTEVSEDTGRPLLQMYVINAVSTHVAMEELVVSNKVKESDEIYALYQRYRNVFFAFNPNYGGRDGYAAVHDAIAAAAGVVKFATADAEAQKLIVQMVLQDELVLAKLMQTKAFESDSNDDLDDKRLLENATPIWALCMLLKQATAGVADGWFQVSSMIEMSTRELYSRAVLQALRFFVKQNNTRAIEYMLMRRDRLFGEIDVNTIVDEKLGFTGIEYAAHLGVPETLEWFMDRQRTRIDQPGAFGRTLVSIASAAGQPISIVAIDKYKFDNKISLEPHINSAHYGIETPDLQNTVLHQCARQHRIDLMRYCFDLVVHQIRKTNRSGHTPLATAEHSHSCHGAFKDADQEKASLECIEFLEQKMDRLGSSANNTPRRSAATTDAALMPPPQLRPPPSLSQSGRVPTLADDEDDFGYDFDLDDDDATPPPPAEEKRHRRKKSSSGKKKK